VALIYDSELIAEVPAAPHDQLVSMAARPGHGITHLC
jgi:hypothetical protein